MNITLFFGNEELTKMAKSIQDLKDEILALKASVGLESGEVKSAIDSLKSGVDSLKALIGQLQAQLLQSQTDASVPLDVSGIYDELAALKADVENIYVAPVEAPVSPVEASPVVETPVAPVEVPVEATPVDAPVEAPHEAPIL